MRELGLTISTVIFLLLPACGSDGDGDGSTDTQSGDPTGDGDGDPTGDGDGDPTGDGDGDPTGDGDGDPTGDGDGDPTGDGDGDPTGDVNLCTLPATVWVATDGADDDACGDPDTPCQTIKHGIDRALPGDAVCVRSGTYTESWVALKDSVHLVSADGEQAAAIYSQTASAVRFDGIDDASIDGFEVYGDWNAGEAGDGLVRVLDATNVTIKNSVIHDAPHDQDCIKVSGQVSGLVIDRVVAYNPAHRTDGSTYQEVIDIFGSGAGPGDPPPVSDVIVRNSWLFHTPERSGDWLIYSKINAENIMYENNVFGPSGGFGNAAVGIGTGEAGIPDGAASVVTNAIVRNNLFLGLSGDGAFTVMNSDNTWVYNNTFWDNSGDGVRSVIMLRGNSHPLGPVYVYGNLFVDNQPTQSGGTFYWIREGGQPSTFEHDYNLYMGNTATSDADYMSEANSVYGSSADLAAPAHPDPDNPSLDAIDTMRAGFAIGANSAAIDASLDVVGQGGHPNWSPGATDTRTDYEGDPRADGGPWDIGADQR